jgi:hypothetical protein
MRILFAAALSGTTLALAAWSGHLPIAAAAPHEAPAALQDAVRPRSAASPRQRSSAATDAFSPRDVLNRYCVGCHNARLRTAGLALDILDIDRAAEHAEIWEKVIRRVRSESMPPVSARRPDKATYSALGDWLEQALDQAAAANPNPGRPSLHRLNRAEYANAVRDLLGVQIDARAYLPADDSGYGFDNIADVLSVSPGLLERYMLAAGKIGRMAVGDPSIRPTMVAYRTPPQAAQDDRMSEDLPF